MAFIIKIGNDYLKYTAHFGRFYGNMPLPTKNIEDARRFTYEKDAIRLAKCIIFRILNYDRDRRKWIGLIGKEIKVINTNSKQIKNVGKIK